MTDLTGARSRVLLIGTGTHDGSQLPDLPAVHSTLEDLAESYVRHCGVPRHQVAVCRDPSGVQEFGDAVRDAVDAAEDVLVVHYVGHGLLDPGGRLYLTTRATQWDTKGLRHRALAYADLHQQLGDCRAGTVVVVLDCCFSGSAGGVSTHGGLRFLESPRPDGGYLLASSAPGTASIAPLGHRHTAFSGTLIKLISEGHPEGPKRWTLDSLFEFLERDLVERNLPAPQRVVSGHAGELEIAVNRQHRPNPYRGLAAYQERHTDFFFGRESLVERLRSRLADRLTDRLTDTDARMLVVVGPSGSGKSSLLRAGLIPELGRRGLPGVPGSSGWPVMVCAPGAEPLRTLATRLAAATRENADEVRGQLGTGPDGLASAIRGALVRDRRGEPGDRRMILVVDQFEEVFTTCGDDGERREFVAALRAASRDSALVVLALRSDFYPRCAGETWWAEAFDHQLNVPAMTEAELREVIEEPARRAELTLEPGLTDRLLKDLGVSDSSGRPVEHGVLPLLSYTLSKMCKRAPEGELNLTSYLDVGRVSQAISQGAEACYNLLRPDDRATARDILPRLVRLGERESEDTRRRVPLRNLNRGASTDRVLKALTDERLIVRDTDPDTGEQTVELAHLVLAHKWDLLHQLIEKDRKDNEAREHLERDAAHWRDAKHPRDHLLRGDRLASAHELKERRQGFLNETAQDFVDASAAEKVRMTRRRRVGVTSLAALAVLVVALILAANQQTQWERDNAVFERVTAQADRLAKSDTSLAAQLALTAYQMRRSDNLGATLVAKAQASPLSEQLTGQLGPFDTVAFGPDGQTIATATTDHDIQLWSIRGPGRVEALGRSPTGHENFVNSLVFSPDGRLLASAGSDESIRLWNIAGPSHPLPLGTVWNTADLTTPAPLNQPLPAGRIGVLTFSPDGRTLAGASRSDHSVRLWNVADPERPAPVGRPLTGHRSYINSLAFSPDGHTLATASADKTVGLWGVAGPADSWPPGRFLGGHSSFVNAVAFSPDGRTLASTGGDHTIHLWDVANPAGPSQVLFANAGDVNSLAFSRDGRVLASANGDRTIRLWNLVNPARAVPLGQPLTGHRSPIKTIGFIPAGHAMASVDADRTVRLWHLPATVLIGHSDAVNVLVFDAGGRTLASGGAEGTVRRWDVSDPAGPKPLGTENGAPGTEIGSMVFDHDGQTISTNGPGLRFWGWGISDPAAADRSWPTGKIGSQAFSPDGKVIAVAGTDQSLSLWQVTGPARQSLLSEPLLGMRTSYVNAVGFSPDGRTLASAGADRHLRLWDVTNPAGPVPIGQPFAYQGIGKISAVAFNPKGDTLAVASSDLTILLWDITDRAAPKALGPPLPGHTDRIHALAFSPDGRTLASAGADQTIWRWDVTSRGAPKALGQPLTGHTGPIHTIAFSPDGRLLASAGADQTIRLWRLGVRETIDRICHTAKNALPEAAWREYVSASLPYVPNCPP